MGEGFIGKDMSFENSAGWAKAQAVALKNSANFTVFFRCSSTGFRTRCMSTKDTNFTESAMCMEQLTLFSGTQL